MRSTVSGIWRVVCLMSQRRPNNRST